MFSNQPLHRAWRLIADSTLKILAEKRPVNEEEKQDMSDSVFWIVEGNIRPGEFDKLNTLIDEMVTNTNTRESGTIAYEWFVDPGKTRCFIFERYRDSESAMIHLHTFDQKYAGRLGQLMEIGRVTLFGNASEEVMKTLGDQGTVFLSPLTGFTR